MNSTPDNTQAPSRTLDTPVNWDMKDLERTMNGLNQMNNPVTDLRFGPEQEAERLVNFRENRVRLGEIIRKILAHPYFLRALPGED